ncbi:amidoligase family protein [Methylosarcina fibrata]|uniref:amidoligase family protein n=1 Tax=Methylosarcina fibrata TaxID=105972 RepID=UPI000476F08B|nr:amidoligase family protein [Methylosarcina fibrata]
MSCSGVCFKSPPVTHKQDGHPRRVGFELEFSGLSLEQTAEVLKTSLGGTLKKKTAVEWIFHQEKLGDFKLELDWSYLKRLAEENEQDKPNEHWAGLLNQAWVDFLAQGAMLLVPVEIACPPIVFTDVEALLPMVEALRNAGAVGTEESLLAAYGVHVNTEIPGLDAETLLSYLKAFALLQWWLVDAHEVDVTRKISPYIDLYPEAYLKKLLSQPKPSMEQIVADYLEYNPSRNRALDLLPMLAHIDSIAVHRVVNDPKVQPRPAFHYRLPNCRIDRKNWSLSEAWNKWWIVEQLAYRPADLDKLGADFLHADRLVIGVNRSDWVEYMDRWLKGNEWV